MRVTAYEKRIYLVEYEVDTLDEAEAIEMVATGDAELIASALDCIIDRDDIRVRPVK